MGPGWGLDGAWMGDSKFEKLKMKLLDRANAGTDRNISQLLSSHERM